MRWILGISFFGVAVWALVPDKYEESSERVDRFGAFSTALVAFFLAEIGDKTQIATVGLAARFAQFYPVVLGTTLGMMLANIPAVFLGHAVTRVLPINALRIAAAVLYLILGVIGIATTAGWIK